MELLAPFVSGLFAILQLGLLLWIARTWNRRHEELQEALACIDDLQERVHELERGR